MKKRNCKADRNRYFVIEETKDKYGNLVSLKKVSSFSDFTNGIKSCNLRNLNRNRLPGKLYYLTDSDSQINKKYNLSRYERVTYRKDYKKKK